MFGEQVTNAKELTGLNLANMTSLTAWHFHNTSRKFNKYTAELHPIPVKDEVLTIGADLIGPLPETP